MVTIDPAYVAPGEVWLVAPPGGRAGVWVGMRPGLDNGVWWRLVRVGGDGIVYLRDDDVRLLDQLVPASREAAERDRDLLRRAHSIVERERDEARDERDEAVARADALVHDLEWHKRRLGESWEDAARAERERDEAVARAEAAEARTTPAVSRADVAEALSRCLNPEMWNVTFPSVVNEICDLFGIEVAADPIVYAIRESDLPEAWRDRDGAWRAGQSSYFRVTPEDMRSVIPATLGMVAARESVARAIEAEEAEAVDPVEELAGQIESATRDAIRQVCDTFATVAPTLDPLAVERAMEVTSASRKIAAHVLGREVK